MAGSKSDGVTGIFQCNDASGRTVVVRATQPVTVISTRNVVWGVKEAGSYG